jgi:hypothetical protein
VRSCLPHKHIRAAVAPVSLPRRPPASHPQPVPLLLPLALRPALRDSCTTFGSLHRDRDADRCVERALLVRRHRGRQYGAAVRRGPQHGPHTVIPEPLCHGLPERDHLAGDALVRLRGPPRLGPFAGILCRAHGAARRHGRLGQAGASVQDRLPVDARLERCGARRLAAGFSGSATHGL